MLRIYGTICLDWSDIAALGAETAGSSHTRVRAEVSSLKNVNKYHSKIEAVNQSCYIGRSIMEIHELVIEMKLLERRMTLYEEKYGVLSEDFYSALISGKLEEYDAFDETRTDFSRWKGIYETWLRRKREYSKKMKERDLVTTIRVQPSY
jgi:hypothetical protein